LPWAVSFSPVLIPRVRCFHRTLQQCYEGIGM
jgi:hypothetical protein